MQMYPKCRNKVERLLALSRTDNKTMICDECGTKEALDATGLTEGSSVREAILHSTRQILVVRQLMREPECGNRSTSSRKNKMGDQVSQNAGDNGGEKCTLNR